MRLIIGILAALLISSNANAHHHHILKAKPSPVSPGGAWCTGGCPYVGGFIIAVATTIVVWEIMEAKKGCAKKNEEARFWRPLCNYPR